MLRYRTELIRYRSRITTNAALTVAIDRSSLKLPNQPTPDVQRVKIWVRHQLRHRSLSEDTTTPRRLPEAFPLMRSQLTQKKRLCLWFLHRRQCLRNLDFRLRRLQHLFRNVQRPLLCREPLHRHHHRSRYRHQRRDRPSHQVRRWVSSQSPGQNHVLCSPPTNLPDGYLRHPVNKPPHSSRVGRSKKRQVSILLGTKTLYRNKSVRSICRESKQSDCHRSMCRR